MLTAGNDGTAIWILGTDVALVLTLTIGLVWIRTAGELGRTIALPPSTPPILGLDAEEVLDENLLPVFLGTFNL